MDLSRYLSPETLLLDLPPCEKQAAIDQLIDALLADDTIPLSHEQLAALIAQREQQSPTCLPGGLALPHARIEGIDSLRAALACPAEPIAWGEHEAQVVCLYLIPEADPTSGIRFMAALAELFGDGHARTAIASAGSPAEALEFIRGKQLLTDGPVLARDIMYDEPAEITPDTPLPEVTRAMLARRVEALPVCDEAGTVVGEIHCDLLFRKGIPDFFMQLANVSFIRNFDPFESYFADERRSLARDVMSDTPPCVAPDATLMEVLFLLSVKDCRRLYVVNDPHAERTLLGAIDRITVLDRVIHQ